MTEPEPRQDEKVATNARKSINYHFKRESQWMVWLAIGLPLLLLAVAIVLGPVFPNALNK